MYGGLRHRRLRAFPQDDRFDLESSGPILPRQSSDGALDWLLTGRLADASKKNPCFAPVVGLRGSYLL